MLAALWRLGCSRLSGLLQLTLASAALEDQWRAVGDDPERRSIGAGRNLLCDRWLAALQISASLMSRLYAAFGAFYFLVSVMWLTVGDFLRKSPQLAS